VGDTVTDMVTDRDMVTDVVSDDDVVEDNWDIAH